MTRGSGTGIGTGIIMVREDTNDARVPSTMTIDRHLLILRIHLRLARICMLDAEEEEEEGVVEGHMDTEAWPMQTGLKVVDNREKPG